MHSRRDDNSVSPKSRRRTVVALTQRTSSHRYATRNMTFCGCDYYNFKRERQRHRSRTTGTTAGDDDANTRFGVLSVGLLLLLLMAIFASTLPGVSAGTSGTVLASGGNARAQCPSFADNSACPCYKFEDGKCET